jgi:hypothetical protein
VLASLYSTLYIAYALILANYKILTLIGTYIYVSLLRDLIMIQLLNY